MDNDGPESIFGRNFGDRDMQHPRPAPPILWDLVGMCIVPNYGLRFLRYADQGRTSDGARDGYDDFSLNTAQRLKMARHDGHDVDVLDSLESGGFFLSRPF